jgi:hypothetical protein
VAVLPVLASEVAVLAAQDSVDLGLVVPDLVAKASAVREWAMAGRARAAVSAAVALVLVSVDPASVVRPLDLLAWAAMAGKLNAAVVASPGRAIVVLAWVAPAMVAVAREWAVLAMVDKLITAVAASAVAA